ncbi:MAG: bifunctional ornithine acetyltransferase/N-acetylglutamate synthase, partial [Actinomycetales bacterium]
MNDCAEAIMTTDSQPKIAEYLLENGVQFVGIAKGAGMLAPSLATMISVIMTDGVIDPNFGQRALEDVSEKTFNRIDSDGCTSTNDTVLLMASGASGINVDNDVLYNALFEISNSLSRKLIEDAEGNTKVIEIEVCNAKSERDAVEIGRACARNNLLKCAIN